MDRIQNHVASGSNPSVVTVYNKAQKLAERAKALNAWANMVTSENLKVIPFKGDKGEIMTWIHRVEWKQWI